MSIFISLLVITTAATLLSLFILPLLLNSSKKTNQIHLKLPPGHSTLPFIGSFLWLRKSVSDLVPVLRELRRKHGPLVTLSVGAHVAVFISGHRVAHQALIHNGAVFADRPALSTGRIVDSTTTGGRSVSANPLTINGSLYGPAWRLLRRNLISEILHPSQLCYYASSRRSVLLRLIGNLKTRSESGSPVRVVEHFRYAIFSALCFMCFGDELDDEKIEELEAVQHRVLIAMGQLNILSFWPRLGSFLFRNRLKELKQLREHQRGIITAPIRSRMRKIQEECNDDKNTKKERVKAYVDTLMALRVTETEEEERGLKEGEIVRLCSELLNAGSDSTSASLQWIMANLVKNPCVQDKLFSEIRGVVSVEANEVKDEDLEMMPYLKAVVLEGLRCHPPLPFGLPHAVSEDIEIGGYIVPRDATVNFLVGEMGRDEGVWEEAMRFKPERFVRNGDGRGGEGLLVDVTGSREIKMMPFGVGRRMCPGYGLALLQLEYFVANLVWSFEWKAVNGDGVDLSEKEEFAVVMKTPLRVHLTPRVKSKATNTQLSI